jgi:hypothetical protein
MTYSPGPWDYFIDVATGDVPGRSLISVFGHNADVDAAEDIWDPGGDWVAPTSAQTLSIVLGTGVRTVSISGLDANWNRIHETVTLNGVTAVSTTKSYIRVFHFHGLTFGSGGTNAGNITATASSDATVQAQITAGEGHNLAALYTIPTGKTGYIIGAGGALNKEGSVAGGSVELRLVTRANADQADAGWLTSWAGGLSLTGASTVHFVRQAYIPVPARTDIRVRAIEPSTTNMDVSAWLDIMLVDD